MKDTLYIPQQNVVHCVKIHETWPFPWSAFLVQESGISNMNVPIYDYVAGRFIFFTKSFSSLATEPINCDFSLVPTEACIEHKQSATCKINIDHYFY